MNRSPSPQTGFTIIEVMVAMVISLILLFGVISIFNAGKQSYTLQNGVARLQENARYALEIMAHSISKAGLNAPNGTTNIDPFVVAGTSEGGASVSDTITVSYFSATDCLGNATAGNIAVDSFAIAAATPATPVTPATPAALTCNGTRIVEGIENMQILYGQDDDLHSGAPPVQRAQGIADRYLPFDLVTLTSDEDPDGGITSVRIAILASTVDDVNNIGVTTTYSLLNATPITINPVIPPVPPAVLDTQIRRVFTRTVLLRNYYNRPKNPAY